jgi:hypothetical protein
MAEVKSAKMARLLMGAMIQMRVVETLQCVDDLSGSSFVAD